MALDRYERVELLGTSHIGEVWQCLDTQTGADVAGMQLNDQIAAVASWDEVWKNVLRYYREFRHEYIVPALDEDREQRTVILELMRGSMRRVLSKSGTVDARLVRTCLRRSLEALSAVHSVGLLHGDIRPDQLLYRQDGAIRLAFSVGLKPGGVIVPRAEYNEYFAPELVNAGAGEIGPGIDLYALGVTAYELLVGSEKLAELGPAVGANTPDPQGQWLQWQADPSRPLPPLGEVFEQVPEDLRQVVDGLVQKDPGSRYSSASSALDNLDSSGRADDVIVPLSEVEDQESPLAGDAATFLGGTASAGSSATPAGRPDQTSSPVQGGAAAPFSPDVRTPQRAGSGFVAETTRPTNRSGSNSPQPTNSGRTEQSSGATDRRDSRIGESGGPDDESQKPLGNVAVFGIAFILVAIGYGGFLGFRHFFPGEQSEYQVRFEPADVKVVGSEEKPFELQEGVLPVVIPKGASPMKFVVSAPGYHDYTLELPFEKNGKIESDVQLQPIVTEYTVSVEPAEANVQVIQRPDQPNPPKLVDLSSLAADSAGDEQSDGNGDADELDSSADRLYELVEAEDSPGTYRVAVPYKQEVTLLASQEGFEDAQVKLKGSGETNGHESVELQWLKTKFTIRVIPKSATLMLDEVEGPDAVNELPVERGTAQCTVRWGETVKVVANMDGYEPGTATLTGTEESRDSVLIELERSPTQYTLNVEPKDAVISVDGKTVAATDGLATIEVDHGTEAELTVSKEYFKPYGTTLQWDESLQQTLDPIVLERDARPLRLVVEPESAKVSIDVGDAGEATLSDGEVMIPTAATQMKVSAPGFRTLSVPLSDETFSEPLQLRLISKRVPQGFVPAAGTSFHPNVSAPILADYTIPETRVTVQFRLVELKEGWTGGVANPGYGELPEWTAKEQSFYYLGVTEVSRKQFSVLTDGRVDPETDDLPAANMTWNEATEFCNRFHPAARLPTEEEWERAARGPEADLIPDVLGDADTTAAAAVNFAFLDSPNFDASKLQLQPVNGAEFNGFSNMLGNVSEWCQDVYEPGHQERSTQSNPLSGQEPPRVIRGGSFLTPFVHQPAPDMRATRYTWRISKLPEGQYKDVGFRVLVDLEREGLGN